MAVGAMGLEAGVDQKNSTGQSVRGLLNRLVSGVRKDEQAEQQGRWRAGVGDAECGGSLVC